MFVPGARGALLRLSLIGAAVALSALAAPMVASAASTPAPPPPASTASCYGSLTPSATTDDPNQLNYLFHCDSRITAYTILANRYRNNAGTIDDFSATASVFGPDGVTADANTSWTCEGAIPTDGINCNTGSKTGYMAAWSWAQGSFDLTDPYCGLPAASASAQPEAPAIVQLIVSDSSGAEDGPFTLANKVACPRPKTGKKAKRHHKHHHHH